MRPDPTRERRYASRVEGFEWSMPERSAKAPRNAGKSFASGVKSGSMRTGLCLVIAILLGSFLYMGGHLLRGTVGDKAVQMFSRKVARGLDYGISDEFVAVAGEERPKVLRSTYQVVKSPETDSSDENAGTAFASQISARERLDGNANIDRPRDVSFETASLRGTGAGQKIKGSGTELRYGAADSANSKEKIVGDSLLKAQPLRDRNSRAAGYGDEETDKGAAFHGHGLGTISDDVPENVDTTGTGSGLQSQSRSFNELAKINAAGAGNSTRSLNFGDHSDQETHSAHLGDGILNHRTASSNYSHTDLEGDPVLHGAARADEMPLHTSRDIGRGAFEEEHEGHFAKSNGDLESYASTTSKETSGRSSHAEDPEWRDNSKGIEREGREQHGNAVVGRIEGPQDVTRESWADQGVLQTKQGRLSEGNGSSRRSNEQEENSTSGNEINDPEGALANHMLSKDAKAHMHDPSRSGDTQNSTTGHKVPVERGAFEDLGVVEGAGSDDVGDAQMTEMLEAAIQLKAIEKGTAEQRAGDNSESLDEIWAKHFGEPKQTGKGASDDVGEDKDSNLQEILQGRSHGGQARMDQGREVDYADEQEEEAGEDEEREEAEEMPLEDKWHGRGSARGRGRRRKGWARKDTTRSTDRQIDGRLRRSIHHERTQAADVFQDFDQRQEEGEEEEGGDIPRGREMHNGRRQRHQQPEGEVFQHDPASSAGIEEQEDSEAEPREIIEDDGEEQVPDRLPQAVGRLRGAR